MGMPSGSARTPAAVYARALPLRKVLRDKGCNLCPPYRSAKFYHFVRRTLNGGGRTRYRDSPRSELRVIRAVQFHHLVIEAQDQKRRRPLPDEVGALLVAHDGENQRCADRSQ